MSSSGISNPLAGQNVTPFSNNVAETIVAHGCNVVLRRVVGPLALELFIGCQPPPETTDAGLQAEAMYRAIAQVLIEEGGTFASIVCETIFHQNLKLNLESVRTARQRVIAASNGMTCLSATTEIEQPPLNGSACLELSIQAVLPVETQTNIESVKTRLTCNCTDCVCSQGVLIHLGDEDRLYSGNLYGRGNQAFEQTLAMFSAAEEMLQQAGMQFSDVVRTWIYLREMERDYADLNRARRQFFKERGIVPPPASTGISAGLVEGHDLCLSIYAVKGKQSLQKTLMTTPTLNEAPAYGADFSRGMRIAESNRETLFVSGTASIDQDGQSVHIDDFDAQVNRMLMNVSTLLEAQGADFGDVVSAITYLKNPADTERLLEILNNSGYKGFANTLVLASVCRPELLCETEALAVLGKRVTQ